MERAKIKIHKGFWTVYDGYLDNFPDRRRAYPIVHTMGWKAKSGWDDRDETIEWLEKTIGYKWVWSFDKLWFLREQDAVLFMLKWQAIIIEKDIT